MTLLDLPMYLVGNRGAILRIAASRWALVVGALLVLSGSVARNYDGAYLAREWDVLLHGIAVSSANALVLFSLMYVATRRRGTAEGAGAGGGAPRESAPRFWSGYLSFLGLFWMSAPMAWLYGVPYERWLPEGGAVQANLVTLGLVSVWRVALMARVLSVMFGARIVLTLFVVMVFSDVAVVVGALASPKPLVDFMGGMQHTAQDAALVGATMSAIVYGILSFPVWCIGAVVAAVKLRRNWQVVRAEHERVPVGLIVVGVLAIMAWVAPMATTQVEQRNRWETNALLRAGKIEQGLGAMSALGRSAYPPIWDPAPRLGWGENDPPIEGVAEEILRRPPAEWVCRLYMEKSGRYLFSYQGRGWEVLDYLVESSLKGVPGGARGFRSRLLLHLRYDDKLNAEQRALIESAVAKLDAKIASEGSGEK
ncbi:MAG: hypothetical protein AB7G11_13945 [Phycisphaerales bacterium]